MTNNLDVSMTKQDVIKVMGHNDEKRLIQGDEVLVYYMHNSVFDLFFTKSFPFVGFYPFNRTGKEFWIVLKDGKVASFGYPADFGKKIR
jgi:hypothetical protein